MNYTYKQIWLLNFPVMLSVLMEQLIHITDAVFLGHVGEIELGASALAGIYYLSVYMLGFGFCVGLQALIARSNGAQRFERTGSLFCQGLFFLSTLALFLNLCLPLLSPPLLKRLITSPEIYQATITYLDWRSYGLLFSFPFLALRAFFVGITRTQALSWAALTAVGINIPLNYLLIFPCRLGIAGAAIASSLAELCSLLVLCFFLRQKVNREKYGLKAHYDGRLLKQVLRISGWSMLHAFISCAPWFLFFVAVEHLGGRELAISNITRSVSTLFFVLVNSLATTAGALVGNLTGSGRGRALFPVCRKILCLGYAVGIPLVGIALLASRRIIGFYTPDSALICEAVAPFTVMLLNYVAALPGYVYINAVTGTGRTRQAFIFQAVTIAAYLLYLYALGRFAVSSLTVYMTAESLFVGLLALQSVVYLHVLIYKTYPR